jgi:hypothetical protein
LGEVGSATYIIAPATGDWGEGKLLETALFLLIYFVPSIVGFYRKHHKKWAIFALNLILGWTVLGWIAAMVWAAIPASVLKNRSDNRAMLDMRATMMSIHKLLFPEDQKTGALVRMKTGLHLEQRLETRLGTMGPEFLNPISSDYDLEREETILDRLPPRQAKIPPMSRSFFRCGCYRHGSSVNPLFTRVRTGKSSRKRGTSKICISVTFKISCAYFVVKMRCSGRMRGAARMCARRKRNASLLRMVTPRYSIF